MTAGLSRRCLRLHHVRRLSLCSCGARGGNRTPTFRVLSPGLCRIGLRARVCSIARVVAVVGLEPTSDLFLRQAAMPIRLHRRVGAPRRTRTATGQALNLLSLPLEYRRMVGPEGLEPSPRGVRTRRAAVTPRTHLELTSRVELEHPPYQGGRLPLHQVSGASDRTRTGTPGLGRPGGDRRLALAYILRFSCQRYPGGSPRSGSILRPPLPPFSAGACWS